MIRRAGFSVQNLANAAQGLATLGTVNRPPSRLPPTCISQPIQWQKGMVLLCTKAITLFSKSACLRTEGLPRKLLQQRGTGVWKMLATVG